MFKYLIIIVIILLISIAPIQTDKVLKPLPQILIKEDPDLDCLAKTIFHEARGESETGQALVATVVINRAILTQKRICEVVYSPNQFSWTKEKTKELTEKELDKFKNFAVRVIDKSIEIPANFKNVTHFCNLEKIRVPKWIYKLKLIVKEGKHTFYSSEKEVSYMKK